MCNNRMVWAKFRLIELGRCLSEGAVGSDSARSPLWDSDMSSSFLFTVVVVEFISGGNCLC